MTAANWLQELLSLTTRTTLTAAEHLDKKTGAAVFLDAYEGSVGIRTEKAPDVGPGLTQQRARWVSHSLTRIHTLAARSAISTGNRSDG
jgi:hypothetical protein